MTNPPTAPALVPVRTFEGLAAVIGEVYPRWHVWARSVREDTTTALMRIRAAHPAWDVAWDDARRVWRASVRISPAATHDIYAHSLAVLEAKLDARASARLSSAETVW